MKLFFILLFCLLGVSQKAACCGESENPLLIDCDDEKWHTTFQKATLRIQGLVEHTKDSLDAMENENADGNVRVIFRGRPSSVNDMREFEVDGWDGILKKSEKTRQKNALLKV